MYNVERVDVSVILKYTCTSSYTVVHGTIPRKNLNRWCGVEILRGEVLSEVNLLVLGALHV